MQFRTVLAVAVALLAPAAAFPEVADGSGAASFDAPPPAAESDPAPPQETPAPPPTLADVLRAQRPTPRGADAAPRTPRATRWDNWGSARVRSTTLAALPLDDAGTTLEQGTRYESRVIHGVSYFASRRLQLVLEADLLNGQFAGQRTGVGTSIGDDTFRDRRHEDWSLGVALPRRAYVAILLDRALLQIGQQTFTWGTGMLANDGAGDADFGHVRQGSLVDRVAVATMPFLRSPNASPWLRAMTVLVAGDFVFRDDNASAIDGDVAFSGVVGARIDRPRVTLGAFAGYRNQRDREDPLYPEDGERTYLRTWVTDVYGRGVVWSREGQSLTLEGEAAFVAGRTDRPYLDETFEDGARIRALGALGRVRYDHDGAGLSARLDLGVASGDNDSRDDVARAFTFHTDHNVGLVLFDQVLPLLTARAVDRVNDPGLLAVTPGGLRYTVNQGAVSNALYLYPVVRWRPTPVVDVRLAWLLARSAADLVDAYQTALAGGYNTTPGGASPGDRLLGHELAGALRLHLGPAALDGDTPDAPRRAGVSEHVGVDAGVFFPGPAFAGLGIDTAWTVQGHFELAW
jgi:hypothetical protein